MIDRTVLHLGAGREYVAREDLLSAGARKVADYDPNFFSHDAYNTCIPVISPWMNDPGYRYIH